MLLALLFLLFFWNSETTAEPRPDSFAMEVLPARLLPRDARGTLSLTRPQAREQPDRSTQFLRLFLHVLQGVRPSQPNGVLSEITSGSPTPRHPQPPPPHPPASFHEEEEEPRSLSNLQVLQVQRRWFQARVNSGRSFKEGKPAVWADPGFSVIKGTSKHPELGNGGEGLGSERRAPRWR